MKPNRLSYGTKVILTEDYGPNYQLGDIGTIKSYNLTSVKTYDGFKACLVQFKNRDLISVPQFILQEIE